MTQIICPHCQHKITAKGPTHTVTCSSCQRQFAVRAKAKPPRPDAAPATAKPPSTKSAAPAKVAPAKIPPVKVAPAKAKPVRVASAPVTPAPAVPLVHAGPPTLRRTHGHPRRKKNKSALLISLVLMVGLAIVGGAFAYVMIGPERGASSQLVASDPKAIEQPVTKSSTDGTSTNDPSNGEQPADPAAKPQEGELQENGGSHSDGAELGKNGEGDVSKDPTSQNADDLATQPVADPTSSESDQPGANSGEEDNPTSSDTPVADKPDPEPAAEPDPAAEVETVVPAAAITFEEADKVLRDVMSHWNARTPFDTAVTAADHLATFDVPEWEKRDYHLDKYDIEHEDQFKSKTEQRFRVSMYFIDQDAEPIISRLYSLTVNAEGRWVIARVKKPKPDLRDAPRANIF